MSEGAQKGTQGHKEAQRHTGAHQGTNEDTGTQGYIGLQWSIWAQWDTLFHIGVHRAKAYCSTTDDTGGIPLPAEKDSIADMQSFHDLLGGVGFLKSRGLK